MKFSEKYGYTAQLGAFQREVVDAELRTKLWNILQITIWDKYQYGRGRPIDQQIINLSRWLWVYHFNKDIDLLSIDAPHTTKDFLKKYLQKCEWYEVYNLLQELVVNFGEVFDNDVIRWTNKELEKHNSAYRFLGTEIAEITDEQQIATVEEALSAEDSGVRTHLKTALKMLSAQPEPDYRNSIKESISAVEAACRLHCGKPNATLGDALKKIPHLHPSLNKGFSAIYGFTNDASGVRHALSDKSNITYADAKLMLVACSAFISYLSESAIEK